MTDRVDLTADNSADVRDRVVDSLQKGGIVAVSLPEEWGDLVLATDEKAVSRLRKTCPAASAGLLMIDGQAAADWCRQSFPALKRLMRGGHGPLQIAISAQDVDASLLRVLPEVTREWVCTGEHLRLCPPAGRLMRDVLRWLSDPVLVAYSEEKSPDDVYDVLVGGSSDSAVLPSEIKLTSTGWELTRSGRLTLADVKRMMAQRIVFVCTGNTCRSPMAEAMFRAMLSARLKCPPDELPERGFDVASAGLAAEFGAPANPESVRICAQEGADLSQHSSQPLTVELLEQADRLYTMTAGHREAIVARHPNLEDRVEILSRNNEDITDPIGCGRDAYERSFVEITENLRVLVDELTV